MTPSVPKAPEVGRGGQTDATSAQIATNEEGSSDVASWDDESRHTGGGTIAAGDGPRRGGAPRGSTKTESSGPAQSGPPRRVPRRLSLSHRSE